MAITALAPWFVPTFFDNSGNPLSGGLIYTYVAGTPSTNQATYSDENLTVPISNPIVLNSAGRPQASAVDSTEVNIYLLAASYKFVLKTSAGVTLKTADHVESLASILYVDAAIAAQTSPTITTPTLISPTITTTILSPGTAPLLMGAAEGRLTLTTGTPVTTGDVTAATTLYFTPYLGNNLGLYDGTTNWTLFPFTQLSIAVPATTSQMYDVFVYNNAGTPTLELTAWSSDTSRATALTTQNGVYVKTGATTRRYLGSFRTTGVSGQTESSFAKRYVWNYYNRVPLPMRVLEATNSWNYSTNTYQQANAAATNQLDFVLGVAEVELMAQVVVVATSNGANQNTWVSIGIDSTTTPATGCLTQTSWTNNNGVQLIGPQAILRTYPAVGRHTAVWLEKATAAGGTTTWYGDNGADGTQSGITGSILG